MSTLIVELPRQPGQDWAWVLTPDGHALGGQGACAPALLPRADELVLVVPWRCLSWHQVQLPRVPASRLREALDGLLEDALLDEPADLHLAVAPGARAGDRAWVAACDRAWLRAALSDLAQAGRTAQRVVPQWAPDEPGPALALGQPGDAWLLDPGASANAARVVALEAQSHDSSEPAPAGPILAEPAVAALAERRFDTRVEVRPHAMQLIACARGQWNLAQFDLAGAAGTQWLGSLRSLWAAMLGAREWRLARWGLAALLGVQVLGLNAWAWTQKGEVERRRAQLGTVLTQTFPSVRVVVDAPLQMERELTLLRQSAGAASPRDLEQLLGVAASVVLPGQVPAAIEYTPGELRLKSVRADPARLARFALGGAHRVRQDAADLVVQAQGVAP